MLLLENLRFHAEEEKNDPKFAAALASYADIYVNDAFGTAHRAHASTVGVARLLPAYAGLLMEAEITALSGLLENPARPFAAVVGGAKVSDKIKVLEHLLTKVDLLVVGGGMANTFLLAQGKAIGKSLAEPDRVDAARAIMAAAEAKGVPVILPVDVIVAKEVTRGTEYKTLPAEKIPASWHIVDTGVKSRQLMEEALEPARTVFWNGPLGVFEIPSFAHGTKAMARFLAAKAEGGATVVVGGGDSVAALAAAGPGRQDDPHQHRRRRLARVPRGPRAAGHRRPAWTGRRPAPYRRHQRGRGRGGPGMTIDTTIDGVDAREILDSRGNPTIEVDVVLVDGSVGRAAVPSGASTGANEAVELRDGDKARFGGKGVLTAVANVVDRIGPELLGLDAADQPGIDRLLIDLDGTPNKARPRRERAPRRLARLRARGRGGPRPAAVPLPRRRRRADPARSRSSTSSTAASTPRTRPTSRSSWSCRSASPTFAEALRAGAEIFAALRGILHADGHATGQGDEGGFAPSLKSNEAAVEVILRAIEKAGYRPGEDVAIALDPATSSILVPGSGVDGAPFRYRLEREGRTLDSGELIDLWASWVDRYPIVSLEDGLAEDDWAGWAELTRRLGDRVQLVGDDLFVTNPIFIARGIAEHSANSVLIKLNQIGTLTETIEAIELARRAGWSAVVSHRSGETEDTTIADFVVAMGTGQIKTGAPSRSERVAKYNRLLRIAGELGDEARYLGRAALTGTSGTGRTPSLAATS